MMNSKISIQFLGIANLASTPIFYIICLFWQKNPDAGLIYKDSSTLLMMAVVFGLMSLSLSGALFFLRKKLLSSISSAKNPNQSRFANAMIVFTLAEIPALFGFVLFILSGNMHWFYAFAGYSLVLYVIFWPRGEELPQ